MGTEERLAYLLAQIEAECISTSELIELQGLGEEGLIPDHELILREWAGLPENLDGQPATAGELGPRVGPASPTATRSLGRRPGEGIPGKGVDI